MLRQRRAHHFSANADSFVEVKKSKKEQLREYTWMKLKKYSCQFTCCELQDYCRQMPNFKNAREATNQLCESEVFKNATVVLCSQEDVHHSIRARVLADFPDKKLLVMTPAQDGLNEHSAVSLFRVPEELKDNRGLIVSKCLDSKDLIKWLDPLPIDGFDPRTYGLHVDLLVCASVAVTKNGLRVGVGNGRFDLEYALLSELGYVDASTVVCTTLHPSQLANPEDVPPNEIRVHDVPVDCIFLPSYTIECEKRTRAAQVFWVDIGDALLQEMPFIELMRSGAKTKMGDKTFTVLTEPNKQVSRSHGASQHELDDEPPADVEQQLPQSASIYLTGFPISFTLVNVSSMIYQLCRANKVPIPVKIILKEKFTADDASTSIDSDGKRCDSVANDSPSVDCDKPQQVGDPVSIFRGKDNEVRGEEQPVKAKQEEEKTASTQSKRKFAFVEFSHVSDALRAIDILNDHKYNDHQRLIAQMSKRSRDASGYRNSGCTDQVPNVGKDHQQSGRSPNYSSRIGTSNEISSTASNKKHDDGSGKSRRLRGTTGKEEGGTVIKWHHDTVQVPHDKVRRKQPASESGGDGTKPARRINEPIPSRPERRAPADRMIFGARPNEKTPNLLDKLFSNGNEALSKSTCSVSSDVRARYCATKSTTVNQSTNTDDKEVQVVTKRLAKPLESQGISKVIPSRRYNDAPLQYKRFGNPYFDPPRFRNQTSPDAYGGFSDERSTYK